MMGGESWGSCENTRVLTCMHACVHGASVHLNCEKESSIKNGGKQITLGCLKSPLHR